MRFILAILFLCCLTSSAQFGGPNLPFFASSQAAAPDIIRNNLWLRWRSADLMTNFSNGQQIDFWIDEIQSRYFTNATVATQPTNFFTPGETVNGVDFAANSGSLLTVTNTDASSLPGAVSIQLIYKFQSFTFGGWDVLINDVTPNASRLNNSGNVFTWRSCCFPTLTQTGPLNTNVITDILSGYNGSTYIVYTNGVEDITHNGGLEQGMRWLSGPRMTIYEINYYTNLIFTTAMVSNMTYYRRAVYGGE